jgi:methyl-accepting chemotaxis protein
MRGVRTASRHLFVRLIAETLVITIAAMSAIVLVLTSSSSTALTNSTEAHLEDLAQSADSRLDAWAQLAQSQLAAYAEGLATAAIPQSGVGPVLQKYLAETESTFSELDLVSSQGLLDASTAVGAAPSYPQPGALGAGGLGATILPVARSGGELYWYAYIPVIMESGHFTGYLAGDIDIAADLTQVFDTVIASTSSPIVIQAVAPDHRLVFSSLMSVTNAAAMAQDGALSQVVHTPSVDTALRTGSQPGALGYGQGHGAAIAGYVRDESFGWAITATEPSSVALAPVSRGQGLAALMLLGGVGLLAIALFIISFRITRPINRLASATRSIAAGDLSTRVRPTGTVEVAALGDSFNRMVDSLVTLIGRVQKASSEMGESAARLAAASSQLASTTHEQSSAATETSATMSELARASAQIAESIDHVATRASLTQKSLMQAQEEIRATSDRTVALSERVRDIRGIVTVINDIAGETNLLAFNAAIEAARAGAAGRGFGVLADEVRRLADRTKLLSEEIDEITRGAQLETGATVMAIEKGVSQLESGLRLMEEVAEASSQVRLASAEQFSASEHVVEAMEQISAAGQQLSATSLEMADTAGSHATIAQELKDAASVAGRSGRG